MKIHNLNRGTKAKFVGAANAPPGTAVEIDDDDNTDPPKMHMVHELDNRQKRAFVELLTGQETQLTRRQTTLLVNQEKQRRGYINPRRIVEAYVGVRVWPGRRIEK